MEQGRSTGEHRVIDLRHRLGCVGLDTTRGLCGGLMVMGSASATPLLCGASCRGHRRSNGVAPAALRLLITNGGEEENHNDRINE
jgi:hypothetical protein